LRRDLICAALGLALAAASWFAAGQLQRSFLSDAVGAEGIPKALAVLIALLSLVIGIQALVRRAPAAADGKNHLRALGIAALGFVYAAVAPFAGYFISISLLAGGAALYYGAPRKPAVALFALGSAAVLWLLFGWLLGIALP
jgi:putative tricarboxylic transport membrane protein